MTRSDIDHSRDVAVPVSDGRSAPRGAAWSGKSGGPATAGTDRAPDPGTAGPPPASTKSPPFSAKMACGSGAILATLGRDDPAAFAERGDDLPTPPVEAGLPARCFCPAAAGAGARPYEAPADRRSDALLPLDHRMMLQSAIADDACPKPAPVLEDVR